MFPLHVSYRGSQLSFAVHYLQQHPDTRLVTLGIGANDLFRCQEVTADHCGGSDLGPTMAEVTSNLDIILGALRNQAHYQHTLVVLTYYAEKYDDPASITPIEALNAAIAGPAAPLPRRPGRRFRRVPRRGGPGRRRHLRGRPARQAGLRRLRPAPQRPRGPGARDRHPGGHRGPGPAANAQRAAQIPPSTGMTAPVT